MDDEEICIITNKSDLEGSCYIEVMPGSYKNKCWNEGSLYFTEEVFGYLEPLIESIVPSYDHYSFTEIQKIDSVAIAEKLERLSESFSVTTSRESRHDLLGFIFKGTEDRFFEHEEKNAQALSDVAKTFANWIRLSLESHESITVLGI